MTRNQAHTLLNNTALSSHEREQILQYLHYLDAEGIANPSAARPKQKNPHRAKPHAGKAK